VYLVLLLSGDMPGEGHHAKVVPIRLQAAYTFRVPTCGCAASLRDAALSLQGASLHTSASTDRSLQDASLSLALSAPGCCPEYPAKGWVARLESLRFIPRGLPRKEGPGLALGFIPLIPNRQKASTESQTTDSIIFLHYPRRSSSSPEH
jgi:hypothetical protein